MKLLGKGTKLYSIFQLKCPKCHEGDLFDTPTFSYRKPFDMPDRCAVCGQNYMPEPGFYFGAMFISYIFTGFLFLGFVMFFHWVLDWSIAASFGLLFLFCAVFFVYFFRLARAMWLNINFKYDPARGRAAKNNA
ncbi:MAG: DUF983 domain-containing protein [Saprospiraceae bacterium]|nr:DUF983 domain-containing protein [Saprospiraceae bacterium]MCB0626871.1 DUF983 domain-containing protein [Saprospiraceae bacterium]MCB0676886.1 DUF983 domain-containing protein [Saprospiraceae bacterium]MCB0680834.1 DUF983 domain-containing protein [Saprospiraceae bacterium]